MWFYNLKIVFKPLRSLWETKAFVAAGAPKTLVFTAQKLQGRLKWPLKPALWPQWRSKWPLKPAPWPQWRSKWPLEPASWPQWRSKWPLEPASWPQGPR